MDALLSGQARVAVLIGDGRQSFCLTLDEGNELRLIEAGVIPYLFRDCTDVVRLVNTQLDRVVEALELAWSRDQALHMSLLLFDSETDREAKSIAADCLEDFLDQGDVSRFLLQRLYASPMPARADLSDAADVCKVFSKVKCGVLVQELIRDQEDIALRCRAWDVLPITLFGDEASKSTFKSMLIECGAFADFVRNSHKNDWTLLNLHVDGRIAGLKNARVILQEWAKPFRESITRTTFDGWSVDPEHSHQGARKSPDAYRNPRRNGYTVLVNVNKQKSAIKELVIAGEVDKAIEYTNQLIDSQRRNSDPEHIAMSLCDLSQHAKSVGNIDLQKVFSQWAIRERPDDAWSHAQLADAYRKLGDLPKAMDQYQNAGVYGHEKIALTGRAEVLKDAGAFEEAMDVYNVCMQRFPGDAVVRNGKAALLGHFGHLSEALAEYTEVLKDNPFDAVPLCGKAQIFREMHRFADAVTLTKQALALSSRNTVAANLLSAIYRETGQFDDALRDYKVLVSEDRYDPFARDGLARTYQDMQDLDTAEQHFVEMKRDLKYFPAGWLGLASVYKLKGRLDEAIAAYKEVMERFPRAGSARNGLAALLGARGRYREATELLPTTPPMTQSDWVSFHVKAMLELKQAHMVRAVALLENGLQCTPWIEQRDYFRTALSLALMRLQDMNAAEHLLEAQVIPVLQPVRDILRLQVLAATDRLVQAKKLYNRMGYIKIDAAVKLRDEIVRFADQASPQTRGDAAHVILDHACDVLLIAA